MVRGALLGGSTLAVLLVWGTTGLVSAQDLPAVSAPNGKIEFDAGVLTLPAPGFVARAAGVLTLPVGSEFGLQLDVNAAFAAGFSSSAAVHVFTRDPQSYLIGGTLGLISTPGALVVAAGPEAELYLDRWTVEAWGGASYAHPTSPGPDRVGPFVMGTVAYYPHDDLRLSLGVSYLDGYAAAHLGAEYQIEGFALPLSLVGDARIGQDGAVLATIGLRGYFGGGPPKSLIERHRQDDPSDRGTALYGAAGGHTIRPATGSTPSGAQDPVTSTKPPQGSPPAPPKPHTPDPPDADPPSSIPPDDDSLIDPHTCYDANTWWSDAAQACIPIP